MDLTAASDPADVVAMQIAAGYRWGEGAARLYLAITLEAIDPQAASAHYEQALDCFRPYGDTILLPNALIGQAGLIARRDPDAALRVCAAAWNVRLRAGGDLPPFYRERLKAVKASCVATLGDTAERTWTEGTRLDLDDAIALALGAIAVQLHLSVRTVESHVRHLLAKIGLQNRTQLATWARERSQ